MTEARQGSSSRAREPAGEPSGPLNRPEAGPAESWAFLWHPPTVALLVLFCLKLSFEKMAVPAGSVSSPYNPSTWKAVLRQEECLEFKTSLGNKDRETLPQETTDANGCLSYIRRFGSN